MFNVRYILFINFKIIIFLFSDILFYIVSPSFLSSPKIMIKNSNSDILYSIAIYIWIKFLIDVSTIQPCVNKFFFIKTRITEPSRYWR